MNYTVRNNLDLVHGTCLCGYVLSTYDHLVEMFGEPCRDVDKSTAHWIVEFAGGHVATIYDWKSQVVPENLYRWHIGGHSNTVVTLVSEVLKQEICYDA